MDTIYLGSCGNAVCNGIRMSMFSTYACLSDIFGVEIKWKYRVDLKDWPVIKTFYSTYYMYFLVFWYVDNLSLSLCIFWWQAWYLKKYLWYHVVALTGLSYLCITSGWGPKLCDRWFCRTSLNTTQNTKRIHILFYLYIWSTWRV